jgi:2-methylisocitrate lyase-like PEP mutase family enzyme
MRSTQTSLVTKFRALHESGCFVLPNPWDIGTAIYLERLGFSALATTSAGFAFSRSKPDGGIPRDEFVGKIVVFVKCLAVRVYLYLVAV